MLLIKTVHKSIVKINQINLTTLTIDNIHIEHIVSTCKRWDLTLLCKNKPQQF